ncbi:hypothetical protein HanXRQr2_Chr06g0269571 [Helianthus annuus]|uniref:Uncharacterized protein n=1 Tax=Helianthus annuus TaxID=4232 RepID=A0A251S4W3_HELAN|nr:hypothetical protein HanXRQr2_Chr06g0269571 [Helianthus annuus]
MINGCATKNQPPEDGIDPFLQGYNPSDLRTASDFLSNWLSFLRTVRSVKPRDRCCYICC